MTLRVGHFSSQGYKKSILVKSLLDEATYQISKACAFKFTQADFLSFSLWVYVQQVTPSDGAIFYL